MGHPARSRFELYPRTEVRGLRPGHPGSICDWGWTRAAVLCGGFVFGHGDLVEFRGEFAESGGDVGA